MLKVNDIKSILLINKEKPLYLATTNINGEYRIYSCLETQKTEEDLDVQGFHYIGFVPTHMACNSVGSIGSKTAHEELAHMDIPVIYFKDKKIMFEIKEAINYKDPKIKNGQEAVLLVAGKRFEQQLFSKISYSMSKND